jgi:2'-5' RNA ligase
MQQDRIKHKEELSKVTNDYKRANLENREYINEIQILKDKYHNLQNMFSNLEKIASIHSGEAGIQQIQLLTSITTNIGHTVESLKDFQNFYLEQ